MDHDSVSKCQRKYVYGRTREIVHSGWVALTRKSARGPVVSKVPTVGQFVYRWLEDTVAPNLAPLTYATDEGHAQNYIEPGIGALRLDRLRVADGPAVDQSPSHTMLMLRTGKGCPSGAPRDRTVLQAWEVLSSGGVPAHN